MKKEPLTDKDSMPFGPYIGQQMADIPPKYLMNLKHKYESEGVFGTKSQRVLDYIVDNLDVIQEEIKRIERQEQNKERR